MFELEHTEQVKRLIDITKSNSGISGPELAKAHIELGRRLSAYLPVEPMDTTVIAMMRGGIFFAQGIYFGLGCKFQLFDPKRINISDLKQSMSLLRILSSTQAPQLSLSLNPTRL